MRRIWIRVSGWLFGGGYRAIYIGGSVNSRPSDQTNLKGQRRCNLGGSGEPTFEGEADQAAHRSAVLVVGPTGPTWQPLGICCGGLPSGVFWSSTIKFDIWVHHDGFLNKPC